MSNSLIEKALAQLESMKVRSLLNTTDKAERYATAVKRGYSPQFALIFALQKRPKTYAQGEGGNPDNSWGSSKA